MSRYILTAAATDDIREIVSYLATQATEETALRIRDKLFASFENLAASPGIGHSRSDLTRRPIVFFTAEPYLIAYRRDITPVAILGILHGARDVRRILRKRPF